MTGVMLFGRMRKEDRIEYRFNNYKNQIEVKCWEKKSDNAIWYHKN